MVGMRVKEEKMREEIRRIRIRGKKERTEREIKNKNDE